jgi:hypothetical protein
MRRTFLEKFGVNIDIPAYYIICTKIVPHVEQHIIVMGCHILPKDYSQEVEIVYNDGEREHCEDFRDSENLQGKDLILRLQKA